MKGICDPFSNHGLVFSVIFEGYQIRGNKDPLGLLLQNNRNQLFKLTAL